MSERRRVGLLFGGRSVEHEVSVSSARGVAAAMRDSRLDCVPLAVAGDGRWLSPEWSARVLAGDAPRTDPPDGQDDGGRVVLDPGAGHLVSIGGAAAPRAVPLDVIFPLVHGWGGEDGRLQGALELVGIPYVGAGVLASAAAMDKVVARQLLDAQGLPSVRWIALHAASRSADPEVAGRRIESELGYPVFVKPANGGSSVGVSRVDAPEGLAEALDRAFECDGKVIVEAGLVAREIECAVLGNDAPEASVLGEIVPSGAFYDYAAKYLDDRSELIIPAKIDAESTAGIRADAVAAYRSLGISGFARVDFLVERQSGRAYLNEVNTLPGFTPISMFPKLWEASGLPYARLIERLVDLARERWRQEQSHRTLWKPGD